MRLLFCNDPLNPRIADAVYAREVTAAQRLGIDYSLISFESLVDERDPDRAVRRVAPEPDSTAMGVYRGWMLKPDRYAALYDALADRRVLLLTNPDAYEYCHYLPRWYGRLAGHTPRSVWTKREDGVTTPQLMDILKPFGHGPVIVKDWVKSQKHKWHEACYIPSAADAGAVERVVGRFLELQGEDLNVGLVFREFVALEQLGDHSQSGMPLAREFRIFFLHGKPIHVSLYWDEGDYGGVPPPLDYFTELAASVESPFFAMDVARTQAGDWIVVELGDGQVSELSEDGDVDAFLRRWVDGNCCSVVQ